MYPRLVYKTLNGEMSYLQVNDASEYAAAIGAGWYASYGDALAVAPIGTGHAPEYVKILSDAASTTTGSYYAFDPPAPNPYRHVSMRLQGSGSVTATIAIQRSSDPDVQGYTTEYEVSLSGTNSDEWGGTQRDNGGFYRASVTSITGTNARVNIWMEK